MKNLLIKRDDALVLAVDYQERLIPAMHDADDLIKSSKRFIKGARVLGIPCVVTQQYTKGLGPTVAPIADALGDFEPLEKSSFNILLTEGCRKAIEDTGRKTVILIGIEAHICIQQTALALLEEGYEVVILSDCVSSRSKGNKKTAEARMAKAGAVITSYEAALFEFMGTSGDPDFKEISKIIK